MTKKVRVAILISGRGSNMQELIKACERKNFPAEICLVLSNKREAEGLNFARQRNIPTSIIESRNFEDYPNPRQAFDSAMHQEITKNNIELICLAGFMRLLSPWFVEEWYDRVINIHPSLLPNFKGADAVGDAIKAKAKVSGCTVHFVREEMDSGPIIMQKEVAVLEYDTKESLAQKILIEEHEIYPESLEIICKKILQTR